MEIAIIPQWIIKKLSSDYYSQNDYNIMISNLIILILFASTGSYLMSFLNEIPHYCLIDKVTGIECPFCGTTRAFCELSNGNLYDAIKFNRASILVALFFIIQIPLRMLSIIGITESEKINTISKYFSQITLTLIILNWIINLLTNKN